jgi:hypothetical protein
MRRIPASVAVLVLSKCSPRDIRGCTQSAPVVIGNVGMILIQKNSLFSILQIEI